MLRASAPGPARDVPPPASSFLVRASALLGAVAVALVALSTVSSGDKAYAFGVSPTVPVALADVFAEAAPVASTVAEVSAVSAGGAAVVATAPVAVLAAAALASGAAIYLGWKYLSGTSPTYADQTAPAPGAPVTYPSGLKVTWPTNLPGSQNAVYALTVDVPAGVSYPEMSISLGNATEHDIAYDRGAPRSVVGPSVLTFQLQTQCFGCYAGNVTSVTIYQYHYGRIAQYGPDDQASLQGAFPPAPAPAPSGSGYAPGATPITSTPTSRCSPAGAAPGGPSEVVVLGPSITYTGGQDPATLPQIVAPACPASAPARTGFSTPSTTPDGRIVPDPLNWQLPSGATVGAITLTITTPDGHVSDCAVPGTCPLFSGLASDANGDTYTCKQAGGVVDAQVCRVVPTGLAIPPGTVPGTVTANDPHAQSCLDGVSGFNPITWVLVPVECAWQWAMVPSAADLKPLTDLGQSLKTREPLSDVLQAEGFVVGALGGAGPHVSGCLVFDAHLGTFIQNVHILNSCDQSEPIVAALHTLRSLLGVAELLAFLGPLAWWAWKAYAPLSTATG